MILTATSGSLINAVPPCSAANCLHTDTYIPVTAVLLLRKDTKTVVPECYRTNEGESTIFAEDAQLWNDIGRRDYEYAVWLRVYSRDGRSLYFFPWLYLSTPLQTCPTPGLLASLRAGLINKDFKLPMASSDSSYIMIQCCKLMKLRQISNSGKFSF